MTLFGIPVPLPLSSRQWRAGIVTYVAYLAATRISSALFAAPAIIFPASGIAMGALFLEGFALWPFVYLASLTGYLLNGSTLGTILLLPIAHTVQAIVGTWILRKFNVDPIFRRTKDMSALIVTAVLASTIVPTFGMLVLNPINTQFFGTQPSTVTWASWYVGTLLSVLLLAPFVMRWFAKPHFSRTWPEVLEVMGAFGLLSVISIPLFWGTAPSIFNISLVYFLLIPLFWISLRLRPRFITLALIFTTAVAVSGTFFGMSAPPASELGLRLFQTQVFLVIITLICYILVSLEEERRMATNLLRTQVNNLRSTLDQLASQNQAKNEFIATLAHELRNPLAPIVSAVEFLMERKLEDQDAANAISLMNDRMRTVKRLLNDLLDVSRISEQKFALEKEIIDVGTLVNRSIMSAQHYYNEREQRIAVKLPEEPLMIEVDPVRIEQVITNLLTNASKFSNTGDEVTITARQVGATIELTVTDRGIGIEPEMMGRIFEPFLQVELGRRTRQGLGIGLALVRNLVELHGGSVRVKSAGLGRGTQFVVLLPATKQKAFVKPEGTEEEQPGTGMRVLVVDDNDAAAWSVGKLIELKGYVVDYAYDAEHAIRKVQEFKPNAVLLDIGLPDMSGYDVAKMIRSQGYEGTIIALTGYNSDEDFAEAQDAGIDHHLVKPVGIADLRKVLPQMS